MSKTNPPALVVLHAFGRYGRGDLITDPATIQAILAGGNSSLVIVPVLPAGSVAATSTEEH